MLSVSVLITTGRLAQTAKLNTTSPAANNFSCISALNRDDNDDGNDYCNN